VDGLARQMQNGSWPMGTDNDRSASLKSKLVLTSVLSVTTVLIALGAYDYATQRTRLSSSLTASLDAAASRLAGNLGEPLWALSKEQAMAVLRPEMTQPDLQAIAVRGTDGAVFAVVARKDGQLVESADAPSEHAGWRQKTFEVQRGGKALGNGVVFYSEDGLTSRLREQLVRSTVQIVLVDACLIGILLVVFSRLVLRPVRVLAEEASWLSAEVKRGHLDSRGDLGKVAAEFRPVIGGMNATMDAYARPIALTAEYVTRIADGDLPPPISESFEGDFDRIAAALNALVETVSRRGKDMDGLIAAALGGHLDVRADSSRYKGVDARVIDGMNRTLDALVKPLKLVGSYLDRIAKGDIPEVITDEWHGDLDLLKRNINTCIGAVRALVLDTRGLAEAAVGGKLGVRADATRHNGDFRAIVQGVNDTLDAIVAPFRAMADYCERISHGEIPPRRSDSVAGDLVPMQAALNRCLDALDALVADANRVAQAAIEGKLALRAEHQRHEGAFRTAIDGINRTMDSLTAPITEAAAVLHKLAERDLRARVMGSYEGDHARIKESVNAAGEALHDALSQVAQSVDQVSSASAQIAASSQAVASGASEQAASFQETTSSLESAAERTRQAADSLQQANRLAKEVRTAATDGSEAVGQMQGAMGRIKASAEGTSQIIKDINDIAFQTNLLALNAAVEAARAGEAGRGFAVVAEEVRSLALRAKEAATKTEELIRQSVKEAVQGEVTAKHVAGKLGEIAGGVSKVGDLVAEIATGAQAVSTGIEQVTKAVTEMDKVTQQNAASAEESSSAASELSGQAMGLSELIGLFDLADSSEPPRGNAPRPRPASRARPDKTSTNGVGTQRMLASKL